MVREAYWANRPYAKFLGALEPYVGPYTYNAAKEWVEGRVVPQADVFLACLLILGRRTDSQLYGDDIRGGAPDWKRNVE